MPAFLGKESPTECHWRSLPTAFSPLVEETAADTVVIDVEGCELLFGSAYELANEIAKRAVRPKELTGWDARLMWLSPETQMLPYMPPGSLRALLLSSPGEELHCLGELPLPS